MCSSPPMSAPLQLAELAQPNYTPPRRHIDALLDLYLSDLPDLDKRTVELALQRVGADAFARGLGRLCEFQGTPRAELVFLLGRLGVALSKKSATEQPALALLQLVGDADARAARQAILAVGKLPQKFAAQAEPILYERFLHARDDAHKRALADALGNLGGTLSLEALKAARKASATEAMPALLLQTLERAALRIERRLGRPLDPASALAPHDADLIHTNRMLPDSCRLVLRCRAGLTGTLTAELRARGVLKGGNRIAQVTEPAALDAKNDSIAPGRVVLHWTSSLAPLFAARSFSSLAFDITPPASAASFAQPADAVLAALTAAPTRALLQTLSASKGPIRYRLHFVDGGHRRSLVWQIATAVRQCVPDLLNDPHDSPWQVEITDSSSPRSSPRIELVPRKLCDPRFAYHQKDVPAASHSPLAAALAFLAEVGEEDSVWDPFVGSGSELIEIALTTSCHQLFGSDIDENALRITRQNATAAKLPASRIELFAADALRFVPPTKRLTRIVSNPPMGRRTRTGDRRLSEFLSAFIDHAARLLADGGRLIWISPQPRLSAQRASAAGLRQRFAQAVDMKGFWGHLEIWEKPHRPRP